MAATATPLILAEKLRKAEADVAVLSERNGLLTLAVFSVGGRIDIPGALFPELQNMIFRCERDCMSGNTTLTVKHTNHPLPFPTPEAPESKEGE
jgi:hypothetical protein